MDTIKINSKRAKMIAHRGVSGLEKENTCPAFVAAGNRSYYGIETDVHITKDGKFIIMHDETTDRITLGKHNINIEENDYSAVENILLPDVDETTIRRDIRIPLLEEYIKICKKYDKKCVLEVKNHFIESDIERLVEEIKKAGYIENIIFISFDLENCQNLRKLLPQNEIQWLIGEREVTEELINTLCDNKLDIDIYYPQLNAENIKMLHAAGIKINCWTCDDKENTEKLAELGVDFITSNILE